MSLLKKIQEDQMIARKERNTEKATALTTLFAEAANVGKNKGNRDSTDEEVISVAKKFISNIEVCLMHTSEPHVISRYEEEISLYEKYLPTQMSELELRQLIKTTIENHEDKSMGKIMGFLKTFYAGRYDGKMASALIKEALS